MACVTSSGPVDAVIHRRSPPANQGAVAGFRFDFLTQTDVLGSILRWRRGGHKRYIVLANPHSVMTAHRNQPMRAAVRSAGLCLPDGVGIVLAAKLLGYGRRHRVTGPSLLLQVCDAGREHGVRHFFLGGAEGVAERLRDHLLNLYPGLQIAGLYCPPFRNLTPAEDAALVRRINRTQPDVVWVAMGAPKQEVWMAAHAGALNAPAMIGVGAAFDFHSGNVRWAPRWVRRSGLEWAHRLITEPRRMWRRNLDSPLFLFRVLAQSLRKKLVLRRTASDRIPSLHPAQPARARELAAELPLHSLAQ